MKHVDAHEMLALHALRALRRRDAQGVEAHLDGCEACHAELVDLEEVVAELARAAPPLTPSEDATRRILDVPSGAPAERRARGGRRPATIRGGRCRGMRPLRIVTGLAVAAVLAMLVVSHMSLRRRLERATAMLAHGQELLAFMSSPEVVTFALTPADPIPDARALVSYDRRSGRVVVVSFDLPPPPAGKVYQLWLIADDVRPGGILPSDRGATVVRARSSPDRRDGPFFAITAEPSPGEPDPTGDIVLLGGPSRSLRSAR